MDDDLQRAAAAYHEAGHAVIAVFLGFDISPEGVEIDERQYTGTRAYIYHLGGMAPYHQISVYQYLAGWLAEWHWHRLGVQYRSEEDIDVIIDCPEDDEGGT
jgi:hypothetical protein